MGATKDFRTQSTNPSTPTSSDKFTMWVNSSGIPHIIGPAGTAYQASTLNATNMAMLGQNVTTGIARFNNGTVNTYTGIAVGSTGTQPYTTFLGAPSQWLIMVGPSGESLAIPAYVRA